MGVIDTVKDVAFLLQKTDNVDLLKRVVELLQQLHSLVDENRALQVPLFTLNGTKLQSGASAVAFGLLPR